MQYKVGIVMLDYNSGDYIKITLDSLADAKTKTPFSVIVVDNGSKESEKKSFFQYWEEYAKKHGSDFACRYIDAKENKGFSGGNNIAIREFMQDENITHICLLNSDVIVTDYWLDYLLEKDKDVIGPVTNAAGNEQTINPGYQIKGCSYEFDMVNSYALQRNLRYKGYCVEAELVTFFATLIKREVIDKIGLLDERFYPGSYEDDDYCWRILDAKFGIWIARDCFVHHFGSGSFANLAMKERKNIGDVNRERFEKKWNTVWKDRTWKLLESCKQDMDFLLKGEKQEWAAVQLDSSMQNIEQLLQNWSEAIEYFTKMQGSMNAPVYDYSLRQLVKMFWAKSMLYIRQAWQYIGVSFRTKVFAKKYAVERSKNLEKIHKAIKKATNAGIKAVCVFAPMYNKENEKDGYIQRIKAIDQSVLKDDLRIYLLDDGISREKMSFDFIDAQHINVVFNSHREDHREEVFDLLKRCGVFYSHSILRFMEDRTNQAMQKAFEMDGVLKIWDVHGSVPEEYQLSGDACGAEIANNIEKIMAGRMDIIVVVTQAMANYLKKKYPEIKAKFVVLPIFNEDLVKPVQREPHKNAKPVIVYAGGTQPWQNIPQMQDIIAETSDKYDYRMYVPNPEEFRKIWGSRKLVENLVVESKSPEQLYQAYQTCDYGFTLRDESPVNLVACPTKLMEYMKFGIIPVLKSTQIGDFVDQGMQYLSIDDLLQDKVPNETERNAMMENNYEVLGRIVGLYTNGRAQLDKEINHG